MDEKKPWFLKDSLEPVLLDLATHFYANEQKSIANIDTG